MATHTLTINSTTLPVGVTTLGPVNVGSNSHAGISIDRTIVGGLNSVSASSAILVLIQTSVDGVTWKDLCGATWPGGVIVTGHGQINTSSVDTGDVDPAVTKVKVIATVTGPASIAIAGTITVT
jgi:hypothetical protein